MAEQSEIAWTDSTFNPWVGCTKVGPGCDHCYAEELMDTRFSRVNWGAGNQRDRTSASNWKLPIKWNSRPFAECQNCHWRGQLMSTAMCPTCYSTNIRKARRRVFCSSLADWLDNEVPVEWLVDLLDLIRMTPNLDWLLLTKRIGIWQRRLTEASNYVIRHQTGESLYVWINDWAKERPPHNVWLGATVVNQQEADRDIPKLLATPAAIRFLSMEPLLGPVNIDPWIGNECTHEDAYMEPYTGANICRECEEMALIDWVIVGGESGTRARPMHQEWVRSLRDRCRWANIPFLFKQWGGWLPDSQNPEISGSSGDTQAIKIGKVKAGRTLDDKLHNEFPR